MLKLEAVGHVVCVLVPSVQKTPTEKHLAERWEACFDPHHLISKSARNSSTVEMIRRSHFVSRNRGI